MPRVVTGKYKGAVLQAPSGDKTRPTTDKVKEALFSIIQTEIYDAKVLDLFSGTGQIGIEALSRGASEVICVDKAGQACAVIKSNFAKLHLEENNEPIKLIKGSCEQVLINLGEEKKKFDIIFMDPPYRMAQKQAEVLSDIIKRYDMLSDDGFVILEHASDDDLNTDVINMKLERSCSYGLCVLTFFRKG